MGKKKLKKDKKNSTTSEYEGSKKINLSLIITALSLISTIVIAFFSSNITKSINEETKKNYTLNYNLNVIEKGKCKNNAILTQDKKSLFTTGAFFYKLTREKLSGEYTNIYAAVVNDENINMRNIKDKLEVFFDSNLMENTKDYTASVKNTNDVCVDSSTFGLLYGDAYNINKDIVEPLTIVHVILQGYNGKFQYITALHFFNNTDGDIVPYESIVINDTDLYDNSKLNKVVEQMSDSRFPNYKVLQDRIEHERTIIKEKLRSN